MSGALSRFMVGCKVVYLVRVVLTDFRKDIILLMNVAVISSDSEHLVAPFCKYVCNQRSVLPITANDNRTPADRGVKISGHG